MAKKGQKFRRYKTKFKLCVIMDLLKNHLSYCEVERKHWHVTQAADAHFRETIKRWERLYLEGGEKALMAERRGCSHKGGRKPKPVELNDSESLAEENAKLKKRIAWLEMENEYLKKLDALIQAEEQKDGRKRK
jgi:transposase